MAALTIAFFMVMSKFAVTALQLLMLIASEGPEDQEQKAKFDKIKADTMNNFQVTMSQLSWFISSIEEQNGHGQGIIH